MSRHEYALALADERCESAMKATASAPASTTLRVDLCMTWPGTVKSLIFTVPGQVMHKSTRKVVLAGADAVAFIADSQRSGASANAYSWRDMEANLKSNGIDFDAIPKVVQFNKRDLPDVKPLQEIRKAWGDVPTFPAVAIRGEGVVETFRELLRLVYRRIDERHSFGIKFGVSEEDFLKGVLQSFG